ncbi:gp32 protein [Mycobacteroides abscessus subsp. abscessus]|uniref:hypothetical protein n=1 Tax=Mycobacteroides abscessus TaxID=36809 RepID=UPI000929BF75|nr:hypothetical protein [Mycobacteroides abscessus]SIC56540.1 gp32 protein [Mycobacteroides abscessus subsp. abscessus]SKU57650.1 gp32 protein [Mycobacteroides abscessus subsp. abscessus]
MSQELRNAQAIEDAREQAAQYLGFIQSRTVTIEGRTFVIPNPSLLSYEQQERYDELQMELESLDRYPDVVDDEGNVLRRGAIKEPHRKDGVRLENYDARLARAILGDEFDEFVAGDGRPSDVSLFWAEMQKRLTDKRAEDSKSL